MPGDKIKVLLVEDDAMIVDMYKLRLEEEGYEVIITDKGSQAIELAKTDDPDIILLDIILPEVDGFSILSSLKSEAATKKIPTIIMTNLGQESDQEKGQQLGAEEYFVKAQHTPADVINVIKKYLK
ncbi:MAG: response regulator [Patescibacteria group bacterium]|jgi:two-component system alkaline phosphatase synthesis response regulator PhoP